MNFYTIGYWTKCDIFFTHLSSMTWLENKLKLTLKLSFIQGILTVAAWALFVKHPRAQGEWCSQNPSEARVFPVIIPIITRNSQFLDSTENCAPRLSLNLALQSIERYHPLRTWITAIARMVLNYRHKLTCRVWYPYFQFICDTRLVFGLNQLP